MRDSLNRLLKDLLLLAALFLVGVNAGGCPGADANGDGWGEELAVAQLNEAADSTDSDLRSRARLALARFQNDTTETDPLVVGAGLSSPEPGVVLMIVACYDEDQDLLGWCIEEDHRDANDRGVHFEECYPVYAPHIVTPVYHCLAFPIELRRDGIRKDEHVWEDYMLWASEEVSRVSAESQQDKHPVVREEEACEMQLPPIFVSIPESDRTSVFLYAYDRAGHKSEPYEIVASPETLQVLRKALEGQ